MAYWRRKRKRRPVERPTQRPIDKHSNSNRKRGRERGGGAVEEAEYGGELTKNMWRNTNETRIRFPCAK